MTAWTQERLPKRGMLAASFAGGHTPSVAATLAPLMVAVFVGFLVIGAALPVLPLHVRDELGFCPAMVGVVAGCQFAAALVARLWSGRAADRRGAKWAVMAGLATAAVAGGSLRYPAWSTSVCGCWLLVGIWVSNEKERQADTLP